VQFKQHQGKSGP